MRFSLRSSSPIRTAIYSARATKTRRHGKAVRPCSSPCFGAVVARLMEFLEGNSRGHAPAVLARFAALHDVAIEVQAGARRDTRPCRDCPIALARGVEPRAAGNAESTCRQHTFGAQSYHDAIPAY